MSDFDFKDMESQTTGLDALLAAEPEIVTPVGLTKAAAAPKRVKVGSLQQLKGFQRVAADTLINKATQELWSIAKDEKGDFYVQRLFDGDQPLKG
jgi:hypothetical protein